MNIPENSDLNPGNSENPEVQKSIEFFKQLEKMPPEQKLAAFLPKCAGIEKEKADEVINYMAPLFYGSGIDFGVTLPEWVKAASEKFWQCFWGLNLKKNVENENFAAGFFVEAMNLFSPNDAKSDLTQALNPLTDFLRGEVAKLPAEGLMEFADARIKAKKWTEKIKNPTERAMVFLFIAVGWKEIEKLGSHVKTHQWLLDKKVISPYTDRAETAKWFREVGLPKGRAGRPKKNTDCSTIQ